MRAGYLASYIYALRKNGIDPAPLLDRHQLPPAFERLPGYMVSARDVHAFVESATSYGDPGAISVMAGFHNARCLPNPFRAGICHAANLLDAIERHNNVVADYGPGAHFRLRLDERSARWSKVSQSPMPETEIFCVASMVGHVRLYTDPRWLPDAVEVGVAAPEDLSRHLQFAGVQISRSPEDGGTHIRFPLEKMWAAGVRNGSEAHCQCDSENLTEPDFVNSVKLLMKGLARTGTLNVEKTARAARTTVRTLQRRLSDAGASHSLLADQARYEVSCDLLITAQDMTVTEIGFELGYRDPGSFSRAFRRLAGMPPAEFRRRNTQAPLRSQNRVKKVAAATAAPR